MSSRLLIEALRIEHLAELATHLRVPEVYEHIGGVPSPEDFILDRTRALEGPGPTSGTERWLNFLVRDPSSHQMLGRLEASEPMASTASGPPPALYSFDAGDLVFYRHDAA